MGDRGFSLSHQFNALERLNGSDQDRSTFAAIAYCKRILMFSKSKVSA